MSGLHDLLERRRDGELDAAGRAELDRLLADPGQAADAVGAERMALLLAGLAPHRDGPELVRAVRANLRADQSRGWRVVHAVRRRVRTRQAWRWAAAAAVLLAALAGGLIAIRPADDRLRVVAVEGRAMAGSGRPLAPGDLVPIGTALRTADAASAVLLAGDGTRISAEAGSLLRVEAPETGLRLHLDQGAVRLEVPPQAPGRTLAVVTAHATTRVVGTRFRVGTGATATTVTVDEGAVVVADGVDERRVAAGGRLVVGAPALPGAPADPRWAGEGLSGMTAPEDGWIADGRPRWRDRDGGELGSTWTAAPDGDGGRVTAGALTATVTYAAVPDGVAIDVVVTGTATTARLDLVRFTGPPAAGWQAVERETRDDRPLLGYDGPRGRLVVVGEAEAADWRIALRPAGDRCHLELVGEGFAAGEERRARVVLGVGPAGAMPPVAPARLRDFARRHPLAQRWGGLRRVGWFGYAGGAPSTDANPNRWFADRVDVRTADGRATFRSLLLADVDVAVANLRQLGAQGVIVWGLEGSRYINEVGFIADPRRLAELAPEMDAVADEVFARFHAAGLRTGVLVRPWRLDRTRTPAAFVIDGAAGEAEVEDRIAYARQRWGCTIFPVMFASNGRHGAEGMPPESLRRIAQRHPGVTLITDLPGLAWRAVAGGWDELSARRSRLASRDWRLAYPEGRDLFLLDGDPLDPAALPALRAGLADGGVPTMRWDVDPHRLAERLDEAAR